MPPSNKISVYLTDATLATICLPPHSISGRINSIAGYYDRIVRESMPPFSTAEWSAIFDANNGVDFDDATVTMAWANVHDTPGLAEKHGVKIGPLLAKMQKLPPASGIAVLEAIRRFWAEDSAAKLAQIGVKYPSEKS